MRSLFALIVFVSSTFAYQILTPGTSNAWTTAGPNQVTWQRVNTDALNFTMLLVNPNTAILPNGAETLEAFVDGTTLKLTVAPPSGGFVAGTGYQVNFVKDAENPTTIYAQSGQFAITQSSTTVSPASTVAAATTPNSAASTTDSSGDLNPTSSTTSSPSSGKNSADRITAAGSTGLIFAALAAFIL